MMSEGTLLERLADAVFGNGREGLVQTVARVEQQQATILRIASDTNDAVHKINGTVTELVIYRDQLPSKERATIVAAVQHHLAEETEHREWWKSISTRAVLAIFGVVLGGLQLVVLARIFGVHP